MADVLTFVDDGSYVQSPSQDPFSSSYNENVFINGYANVLTLDDDPPLELEIPDEDPDTDGAPTADTEAESGEDSQLSPDGVLDGETVASGLTNLGRSADGSQQAYLHLAVPGFNLVDIGLLLEFIHLQKVEMPYNQLTDLTALGCMPHLLYLDASHNKVTELLNFHPPRNLKEVDLSFNEIAEMSDLSAHHYLHKLVLDNNRITTIKGLETCRRLTHLSLAHNQIERIQGLTDLCIRYLNLRSNRIKKVENMATLTYLQSVVLAGNAIRSLEGLERHEFLESVDVEGNEVIDIAEISYLKELAMLRDLNLQHNPIQELPDYRLCILYRLQNLSELDRHKVDAKEKVAALNFSSPPLRVVAAHDHIRNVVYSFLQPTRILDCTLPSAETPYPMLVLVGPQGAGKHDLAHKLVEEFSDYFGYGVSHTTRKMHPEESQGKDYNFVTPDEFESEIKQGAFLQTYQYRGEYYGLTVSSVEGVARDGLACVVHMELEGVLTLKTTHFEPRYVLIMPLERPNHEQRLRDRGMYSDSQIADTLSRTELYRSYNQDHPGFFDRMIPSDNIGEAYRRLRRLVLDYLGLGVPASSPRSEDGGDLLSDSVYTAENYTTGGGLGPRTWSRPSLPDSVGLKTGANKPQSPAGKGVVEEASLRRRQSAAKDAVAGRTPGMYDQILQPPTTAPLPGSYRAAVEEEIGPRSRSAPYGLPQHDDAIPPGSPDSSSRSSRSSTSLSNLSSVQGGAAGSDAGIPATPKSQIDLPSDALDPMELMSQDRLSGGQTASQTLGSRHGSATSRPDSETSLSRPGSHIHKVLPPISTSPKPDMQDT